MFTSDILKHAELLLQTGGGLKADMHKFDQDHDKTELTQFKNLDRTEGNKATFYPDQTTNYAQKPSNKLR